MTAYSLLLICLLLGVGTARLIGQSATLATSLNWWVLNIALPATILHLTPHIRFTPDMWFLVASMWLVFAVAWGVFASIGKIRGWSRGRIGALTLVCGLSNSSFVGYPMIEALRGREAMPFAIVADQGGVFVMLAIGGALVTSIYASGTAASAKGIARRVFLFPPFIALILGMGMGLVGTWPTMLDATLQRIGDTLVPIALFSVGLQVRWELPRLEVSTATIGLIYKLALAPLGVYALAKALDVGGLTLTVAVLQSAMAPMISAAILAEQHNLEPRLANFTLALGIVLSFATVPLINGLIP
jgi:predicted permease